MAYFSYYHTFILPKYLLQILIFKMKKFFTKIEFLYFAVLPYLAYFSILYLGVSKDNLHWLPMWGWVFVLVYQSIYLGWLQKTQEDNNLAVSAIIPPILIGVNQAFMNGNLAAFFIENMVLEGVTLILALNIVLMFFKNHKGVRAWDDIGILPLMVSGFLLAGCWVFITSWWEINFYRTKEVAYWNLANFALAFVLEFRANIIILNSLVKREVKINDILESKTSKGKSDFNYSFVFIIGQMILWVAIYAVYMVFFN